MRFASRRPRELVALFVLVVSACGVRVAHSSARCTRFPFSMLAARWGGDETWLMREFVHQAGHGVLLYPESFGEPVRTNGSTGWKHVGQRADLWRTGNHLFPGIRLCFHGQNRDGASCSPIKLGSLYFIARSLKISPILSALSVALMVMSQRFRLGHALGTI